MTTAADARRTLEAAGFVVLRRESHRRAQERQRVAEALLAASEDRRKSSQDWAVDCLDEQRRLADRLTFVWGVAMAHGATSEELAADPLTREHHTRMSGPVRKLGAQE